MMGTNMSTRPAIRELELMLAAREWPEKVTVLQAGCGAEGHLQLPENAYTVGIDISEKQLARNDELSTKIVADIVTYDYELEAYDLVICWNVLEHLNRPDLALAGFVRTVRPDGLIVVAAPNIRSLKTLVTKLTPYRFHVFVIRHILGNKRAGTDDFGPFPTFLKKSMSPKSLEAFARREGLSPTFYRKYDTMLPRLRRNSRALYWLYAASSRILQAVSLGFCGGMDNSDYIIVLEKAD